MPAQLESSVRYCNRLARERARNFYPAFLLLSRERREAFCAVYAFMRYADDVADGDTGEAEKAIGLRQWREALGRALEGDYGDSPVFPAFHEAVRRYSIPSEYLFDLITGTEMDLYIRTYNTFDELYQYCYRVASVVGLVSLHIFGFSDPAAPKLAEECGIAFQLTNILRDVRADAAQRRVYLPLEDLQRFHVPVENLVEGVYNQAFSELMRFQIERARSYYGRALPLLDMVEPESRPALWTLISVYRGILRAIERNEGNVFSRPAGMTDMEKIGVLLQAAGMRLRYQAGLKPEWQKLRG